MADQFSSGGDMSADDAKCLVDNMDQDALRDSFAAEFMTDAEGDALVDDADNRIEASMFGAVDKCEIDAASLGF